MHTQGGSFEHYRPSEAVCLGEVLLDIFQNGGLGFHGAERTDTMQPAICLGPHLQATGAIIRRLMFDETCLGHG